MINLHVHTEYSFLDGMNPISKLVARAKELGQPALAITDHGNLHGIFEFVEECRKAGIKPIPGCEFYVVGDRFARVKERPYHLTVLAYNVEGVRNLYALSHLSYSEGMYVKPRIDRDLLFTHHAGLIVLSGCLAGELARTETPEAVADAYAQVFKSNYYLEVQPHEIPEQRSHNQRCRHLSHKLGLPVVATNDVHYQTRDQRDDHNIFLCINTGTNVNDADRMQHTDVFLHLAEDQDLSPLGADAIENAHKIACQCEGVLPHETITAEAHG